MLLEYSKRQWSRGDAWRDLVHLHRPHYMSADGQHDFEVLQHGFRKHHDEDYWGWYVAKWCLVSEQILTKAPCEPPELDPDIDTFAAAYVWDVWVDHDGARRCGFVVPHVVKSRCFPHNDPDCEICQAAGAWSPP